MKPVPLQYAAIGLVIIAIAAASTLSVPDALASTYTAALGLILGAAFVILISWRNALPTETIGQLLQRTEANERPQGIRARGTGTERR